MWLFLQEACSQNGKISPKYVDENKRLCKWKGSSLYRCTMCTLLIVRQSEWDLTWYDLSTLRTGHSLGCMRRGHVAIVTVPVGCRGSAGDDWRPGDLSGEGWGWWGGWGWGGHWGGGQWEIQWSIMGFQGGVLGGRSPGVPNGPCRG